MKLFKKLAAIYSASNNEAPIRNYIKRWIRSSVPGVKVKIDAFGNMYITKGKAETYPCVVAHLDQVQKQYPKDYKVVETNDMIFGYSPSLREFRGLGADDKCGIWIALKMLKKHDAIKVAFFPGEEIGCVGSSQAKMSFFSDVRFVVEPDRRGARDLITSIGFGEICSQEFLDDMNYQQFGYKPTNGMMTDVETLKAQGLGVACINLSCGYYSPHTESEYVVKADMINALNFVDNIIANCTKVYHHEYVEYGVSNYSRSRYDRYTGYSDYKYYDGEDWHTAAKPTTFDNKAQKDYDAAMELYYQQMEEAAEYMEYELRDNPNITVFEFINLYGDVFDMLVTDDFITIMEDTKEMLTLEENSEFADYVENSYKE